LLLALRHALSQSCHWSIAWSLKLCWLLTTFQSDAASAHWRPSLVSDKHVPVCCFSWCLQALVHWCGFHASRGESEWCILLWCLAAQSVAAVQLYLSNYWKLFAFQRPARAQQHWAAATQNSGHSHQTCDPQQTRPQSCFWQSHSGMRMGGSKGGIGGTVRSPQSPKFFYKHNTTSSCTILQVYGH